MNIEYINITSYIGISSNAEHFYAKVGIPYKVQEYIATSQSYSGENGVDFVNGKELRYYPSKSEARNLWKKDNEWDTRPFVIAHKEDDIKDLQEYGTIRFPSIASIVKAAKRDFPDSVICFCINGSRKDFAKYMERLLEKDKETLNEILDTLEIKRRHG